jgi:hypothetical protein
MSNDFAKKVFKQGGPPPHGFKVSLSEDIVKDPLKQTHDAMRSFGLRALVQPIFDGYEGLTPDKLQYKLQELRKKR